MATIVAGIASFWMVVDFPDTATFITEAERRYIVKKLQDDGQFSAEGEKFALRHILAAFRDYKTWLFSKSKTRIFHYSLSDLILVLVGAG